MYIHLFYSSFIVSIMNFKDLQYSIGKLKSDVQSQLARNNPMQKQDTKSLSLWIFEERNDLASMRTLAYQRLETNKALKQWVTEPTPGINMQDLEVSGKRKRGV